MMILLIWFEIRSKGLGIGGFLINISWLQLHFVSIVMASFTRIAGVVSEIKTGHSMPAKCQRRPLKQPYT